jgi:hypothetical protein
VLRTLPVLRVGWLFANQVPKSQGKIVHGGSFNGNEEEGKKEETLTNRSAKRYFARAEILNSLSGEAPLERHFRSGAEMPLAACGSGKV